MHHPIWQVEGSSEWYKWKVFIGRKVGHPLLVEEKDDSWQGCFSLRGKMGSYPADDLIFLWGMERAQETDSIIFSEEEISD